MSCRPSMSSGRVTRSIVVAAALSVASLRRVLGRLRPLPVPLPTEDLGKSLEVSPTSAASITTASSVEARVRLFPLPASGCNGSRPSAVGSAFRKRLFVTSPRGAPSRSFQRESARNPPSQGVRDAWRSSSRARMSCSPSRARINLAWLRYSPSGSSANPVCRASTFSTRAELCIEDSIRLTATTASCTTTSPRSMSRACA
uniref:Putative secreted protein n=1 Tax=Ixodes ricinus TaxID=34613 RepID=A0A6B0V1B6_IXORI